MEDDATIRDLRQSLERMTEQRDQLREVIYAVVEAITHEGSNPAYHKMIVKRHRKEWKYLWKKLDSLVKVVQGV